MVLNLANNVEVPGLEWQLLDQPARNRGSRPSEPRPRLKNRSRFAIGYTGAA